MVFKTYESHKVVKAAQIIGVHDDGLDIGAVNRVWPTEPAMKLRAEVGGYYILYPDGYTSVSPQKAFEEGYTEKVDQ
jgi:hypothetical protein